MIRIRYLLKRIWRWSSFDSKETVSWSTSPPLPLSYAHYLSNTSTLFSPLISTFNALLSSDSDIHPPKRESKSLLFFFVWPTSDLASATNFHLKPQILSKIIKGFVLINLLMASLVSLLHLFFFLLFEYDKVLIFFCLFWGKDIKIKTFVFLCSIWSALWFDQLDPFSGLFDPIIKVPSFDFENLNLQM